MTVDLATIERVILAAPPSVAVEFPPGLFDPEPIDEPSPYGDQIATATTPELMAEAVFLEQWAGLHDVAGFTLQMRIGAPVPLGEQARDDPGQAAGRAIYAMICRSPAMSRLLLMPDSDIWGSLMMIGMHGLACGRIIAAARDQAQAEQETKQPDYQHSNQESDN